MRRGPVSVPTTASLAGGLEGTVELQSSATASAADVGTTATRHFAAVSAGPTLPLPSLATSTKRVTARVGQLRNAVLLRVGAALIVGDGDIAGAQAAYRAHHRPRCSDVCTGTIISAGASLRSNRHQIGITLRRRGPSSTARIQLHTTGARPRHTRPVSAPTTASLTGGIEGIV